MSVIESISQFLAGKPSLEWVGYDLYCFPSVDTSVVKEVAAESDLLQAWPSFALGRQSFLFPTATGILLTSVGVVLMRKWQSRGDRGSNNDGIRERAKNFETSIRGIFRNQSERTITLLEGLIERIPNDEPEILLFFTSEESNVTALNLSIKLMRLIFLARGEDKKLDEIEQEHVVSGVWYNRDTISWHFLKELQTTLPQKIGIIISDFQNVHPCSAALLTFQTRDLLSSAKGAYLFLIINTDTALDGTAMEVTPEEAAMNWWLTQKLEPFFKPEVLEGIQQQLGERSCVILKEPLSTIIAH